MSIQASNIYSFSFSQQILRSVSAFSSLLVTLSCLAGVQVNWRQTSSPLPGLHITSRVAQAQPRSETITAEEITGYARSVLQMDAPRTEAYTRVKNLLMAENLSASELDMSCPNANSLSNLPRRIRSQVREIIVRYCTQAAEIVVSNGLSVSRFNEITAAHQQTPALQEQIRQAMIDLQQ